MGAVREEPVVEDATLAVGRVLVTLSVDHRPVDEAWWPPRWLSALVDLVERLLNPAA